MLARMPSRSARTALASIAALVAGCASTPEAESLARKADLETPAITHVVLVQLKDPSRTAELVDDCDRALPGIESVRGYACGVPMETGRSNVIGDYDVGIYVGFVDAAGYRAYLDDPRHLDLVERWREGWKAVRIFDVISPDAPEARKVPTHEPATPEVPAPEPKGTAMPAEAAPAAPAHPPSAAPSAAPPATTAITPGASRNAPSPAPR
jgi:hypothetical protein